MMFVLHRGTLLFVYRNGAQASVNMNETSHVCTHHVLFSVSQPFINIIKRINCSILAPQCEVSSQFVVESVPPLSLC